jgi:hypothetical protein
MAGQSCRVSKEFNFIFLWKITGCIGTNESTPCLAVAPHDVFTSMSTPAALRVFDHR